jgi:hypothetical protein
MLFVTKRFLPIVLAALIFVLLINPGCTKLDTTTLGSDLIPVVDNVNTFADTFNIKTAQGIFDDSFKIFRNENNVLGLINNDPVFGSTDARVFLQFKPAFFPYYFGNAGDTLVGVDSVVLGLSYKGVWGDTTKLQNLEIYEINDAEFGDSVFDYHNIRYQPSIGALVGSGTIDLRTVAGKKIIANGKDSVTSQVRIKLSNTFSSMLFGRDTLSSTANNAFRNDSLFRKAYKGLAIKSSSGNALMYISLSDANTRLEVHFRKKNAGKLDTTYNKFTLNASDLGTNLPSATSNYISRDWSPEIRNNLANLDPTAIYLQTGPGTYANLTIDSLTGLTNRIVHRASIYIEQDPVDLLTDSIFSAPPYMYLDLIDTGATKWKPIYFDLNPSTVYDPDNKTGYPYFPGDGTVDHSYFGGFAKTRFNALGQKVAYYDINITRYVQQIATKRTPNYRMRLYPAFRMYYPQYAAATEIPYDNPVAFGRVKVKSGRSSNGRSRMQMVIIWSKL